MSDKETELINQWLKSNKPTKCPNAYDSHFEFDFFTVLDYKNKHKKNKRSIDNIYSKKNIEYIEKSYK
jgi:hypothetical protein